MGSDTRVRALTPCPDNMGSGTRVRALTPCAIFKLNVGLNRIYLEIVLILLLAVDKDSELV